MEERQGQLLTYLIEEYVSTSEPVGSKLLSDKYDLSVSPATIRNDMAALEEEGFIMQPHISAGRVPTEKAYRYWIQHTKVPEIDKTEHAAYKKSWLKDEQTEAVKSIAKTLVDYSDSAVVVAFSPYEFYYTGLSALFRQPEFEEQGYTVSLASVIDHLDSILIKLVQKVDRQTVLLGRDNPFGKICGFVGAKIQFGPHHGCMGILGPLRMDYPMNMARMNAIGELINL